MRSVQLIFFLEHLLVALEVLIRYCLIARPVFALLRISGNNWFRVILARKTVDDISNIVLRCPKGAFDLVINAAISMRARCPSKTSR